MRTTLVSKTKSEPKERFTIYLEPKLAKAVQHATIDRDMSLSDLAAEALAEKIGFKER